MWTLITILHVMACLFLILVVLLQAGKGGGMGVTMGAGTSAAVFGGRGAGSFLEKLTAGTAMVFMVTSMSLAWNSSRVDSARLRREADAAQKLAAEKAKTTALPPGLPPGIPGMPQVPGLTQPGMPPIPGALPNPLLPTVPTPGGGLQLTPPGASGRMKLQLPPNGIPTVPAPHP